jgi:pyruvate ferredoxin oxidoreductase gamma subunit
MQIDKDLLVKSKWGYKNAPKGGINPVMGSTVTNDLSAVRCGEVPLYLPEKCIHCGLCDTTCPDMVFRFEPGEYNKKRQMVNCGLDYHHCKGCLRCVDVCPTHALVKADERSARLRFFVRNKDLIAEELDYEKKGANSWVTTESQQNDGGLEGGTYER